MAVFEGFCEKRPKSAVSIGIVDQQATCAPTSTLFSSPFIARRTISCPSGGGDARRRVTDAEVVTLCVAQSIMGIPSDRRFLAVGEKRLGHLFPELPQQPGYHKRRARLARTIEWLIGMFAADSPGFNDNAVLLDSTPVECGRSLETVRRSALADWAGYGYSRSHSRVFWGMRLHLAAAPDGTPRAWALVAADRPEREVALKLLPQALRGQEALICDKAYAGRQFAAQVGELGAVVMRPLARTNPTMGCISPRSASGSNRSSGPAKTCSPSSATAPAPSPTSTPGSPAAS
ncbi:MAG: hypothetical protein ACXVZO_10385 [Gaiellaceae bacterium]